ncbi:AAC(3) family N-acetyltransferase [Terrilactibacillus sp. S3-3]|nr:AAC(3) family N-acetyltransferase [Terrilactibacillus sp. S3-3]
MTEKDVIRQTRTLVTRASLVRDLKRLGMKAGMIVLVHTSMSKLGWVCGGPVTIIRALHDVLTGEGTLIMPAHSADVSDPEDWGNPAVPRDWWTDIYDQMPVFDPLCTPTCGIGRVAECFRTFPGVERSSHPIHSFIYGVGKRTGDYFIRAKSGRWFGRELADRKIV